MNKINAVIDLSREFNSTKLTETSFKRSIKAAKTLGFSKDETLRLLSSLEFCDSQGNGFKNPFIDLMQQFMAKPDATEPHEMISASAVVEIANKAFGIKNSINERNMITLLKALKEHSKISAIKEIRAMLGCGLKEAKDIAEGYFF